MSPSKLPQKNPKVYGLKTDTKVAEEQIETVGLGSHFFAADQGFVMASIKGDLMTLNYFTAHSANVSHTTRAGLCGGAHQGGCEDMVTLDYFTAHSVNVSHTVHIPRR
eukprot:gene32211-16768_t